LKIGGKERMGKQKAIEGVNLMKVKYMYVQNITVEPLCILIHTNKNAKKGKLFCFSELF
jgi:hypothetical protein